MKMIRRASSSSSSPGPGTGMLSIPSPFLSSLHNRFRSKYLHFNTLDDALSSFNRMFHMHPPLSIVDFAKILTSITNVKRYSTVLSLSR